MLNRFIIVATISTNRNNVHSPFRQIVIRGYLVEDCSPKHNSLRGRNGIVPNQLSLVKGISFRKQEEIRVFRRKGARGNRAPNKPVLSATSWDDNLCNHLSHIREAGNKSIRQIPIIIGPKVLHFGHENVAQLVGNTNQIHNGRIKPKIEVDIANKSRRIICHCRHNFTERILFQ